MNALNVLVYFGAQNKHGVFWCILGTQNIRAGLKKTIANLFLSVFVFVVDFVLFVFAFVFVAKHDLFWCRDTEGMAGLDKAD